MSDRLGQKIYQDGHDKKLVIHYNKNMIKAIFFDLDGTLLELGQKEFYPEIIQALSDLRKKGILTYIATGRPAYFVPEHYKKHFYGTMAFNGAYVKDPNGIIVSNPLPKEDIYPLLENAEKMKIGIAAATNSQLGSNIEDQKLITYFKVANQECHPFPDFDDVIHKEDIYQMMAGLTKEQEIQLLKGTHSLQTVRWYKDAVDIISKDGGKSKGIQAVLDYYHLDRSECMAFGDGGNDVDMIDFAHIGVAMEDGNPAAKEVANYICPPANQLGVITALKHFEIL